MNRMFPISAAILALCVSLPLLAQTGADAGQQLYKTHCFVCHGQEGESIPGVSFRSGKFRRASTDEELARLILNGIPGTGMPPTNLTVDDRRNLVLYLRSMHSAGADATSEGNIANGKAIFEGKGGCVSCHRVAAMGSRSGPDLSDIGSLRNESYLAKSLLDPDHAIAPSNRFIHAVTKQGVVIDGRRLNEDTHTIQIIDKQERLMSLNKSDLREFTLVKASSMPSYRAKLSQQEITDLVSFLLSLKEPQ